MKIEINNKFFDAAIIGGGLAGLSLSILLSKSGYQTILFEKEKYPFHRVCGEYISMESWKFIESLGLNLSQLDLPIINKLIVSSPGGDFLQFSLKPGGFGISRYFLDDQLKKIAIQNGVIIQQEAKVNEVIFQDEIFTIQYKGRLIECVILNSTSTASRVKYDFLLEQFRRNLK